MPYDPTPAMWATVIGGCLILGKNKLGKFAAEKLLEMRPCSRGYYVLVANMYADYGCWEKRIKIRNMKAADMCSLLDGLSRQLEEAGYIMPEDALQQRLIHTCKDDITLPRSESVGPALLEAIEESRLTVIILSN
ncbi:tetratricopeptide repeat (TPR)-like superfamily protein [Artemisia annua]|uniref:Tetratricopeptide repeat (TPR)-like superfamily protein n=1 Tax=Artemisia annua TaxID=35608 RepID=A0A2U1LDT3_ARTAN|nr:tetratricopeptide repeat (TPR)-like superfamily protein [Artemisia annua]